MCAEARRAGAAVRAVAAAAVARIVRDRLTIEESLATARVPPRDAALLAALVYGALRWHHRLEWQAGRLLDRPLKPGQADLAALLRVGLLQLQELRIPDHAAVSATVDATADLDVRDARGLVNAVLRRFQRERAALDAEMAAVPEARLSHPQWLIELVRRDRPEDWEAILEQNNRQPPMWLRVNLQRIARADYLARLETAGIAARAGASSESAVLLAEPLVAPALPGFGDGLVSVQDAAAQLAPSFLTLAPGQRVLDACAAPGGKTCHILEACPGLAEVWGVDRDPRRLGRVRENLARLGLDATVLAADATRPAEWWDGRPFDRILLDAPCSALGVVRRHPDIKVLRRPEDLDHVVELQARLLESLWSLLAPGGRLVYATCTILRRENDDQVLRFLSNIPDAELPRESTVTSEWFRQIVPGEENMDGFYYACMDKQTRLRS